MQALCEQNAQFHSKKMRCFLLSATVFVLSISLLSSKPLPQNNEEYNYNYNYNNDAGTNGGDQGSTGQYDNSMGNAGDQGSTDYYDDSTGNAMVDGTVGMVNAGMLAASGGPVGMVTGAVKAAETAQNAVTAQLSDAESLINGERAEGGSLIGAIGNFVKTIIDQLPGNKKYPTVSTAADPDPKLLPSQFPWEGSWATHTDIFGKGKLVGWDNLKDHEGRFCPDGSYVSDLWINYNRETQMLDGVHFRCNDPANSEQHLGFTKSMDYVNKRAPHLSYYDKLPIRSDRWLRKIGHVGFDLGVENWLRGNSGLCALTGFKAWIWHESGFPEQIGAAFHCNNLPTWKDVYTMEDIGLIPSQIKLEDLEPSFIVDANTKGYTTFVVGAESKATVRELDEMSHLVRTVGCDNGAYINRLEAKFNGPLTGLRWTCIDGTSGSAGDATGEMLHVPALSPQTDYYSKLQVYEDLSGIHSINGVGTNIGDSTEVVSYNGNCALIGFVYRKGTPEWDVPKAFSGVFLCNNLPEQVTRPEI
jgi:hypothetical protein